MYTGVVDEQCIPYQDLVPSDPSFDDMKNVVCDNRMRPQIPDRWLHDDVSIRSVLHLELVQFSVCVGGGT